MNYCFSLAVMKSISISAPKKLAKFTVERETGNKSESNDLISKIRGKMFDWKTMLFSNKSLNLSRICQELVYPFSKSS